VSHDSVHRSTQTRDDEHRVCLSSGEDRGTLDRSDLQALREGGDHHVPLDYVGPGLPVGFDLGRVVV
jgi:hypothetical protein